MWNGGWRLRESMWERSDYFLSRQSPLFSAACVTTSRFAFSAGASRDRHGMFTTRPELRGTFGVVASTHWLASAVGMSILERGGNAFDAAVATGFTL